MTSMTTKANSTQLSENRCPYHDFISTLRSARFEDPFPLSPRRRDSVFTSASLWVGHALRRYQSHLPRTKPTPPLNTITPIAPPRSRAADAAEGDFSPEPGVQQCAPGHTRIRCLSIRLFTAASLKSFAPAIRDIAERGPRASGARAAPISCPADYEYRAYVFSCVGVPMPIAAGESLGRNSHQLYYGRRAPLNKSP